jgi:hypothetical protein
MKLNFLILFAAASLGLAAQTSYPKMTAQVPFPFEITGKPMPAGTYQLNYSADQPYATVRHVATGRGFLFDVRRGGGIRLDRSMLTYLVQGDRRVLASVTEIGTGNKIELPKSRAAKELTKAEAKSVAVTVAE